MNQDQKDHFLARLRDPELVLGKGFLGRGRAKDGRPESMCALGVLLDECGDGQWEERQIVSDFARNLVGWEYISRDGRYGYDAVKEVLPEKEVRRVYETNDSVDDPEARKNAVIALVETLPVEESTNG